MSLLQVLAHSCKCDKFMNRTYFRIFETYTNGLDLQYAPCQAPKQQDTWFEKIRVVLQYNPSKNQLPNGSNGLNIARELTRNETIRKSEQSNYFVTILAQGLD